jgi:hypothetical protein
MIRTPRLANALQFSPDHAGHARYGKVTTNGRLLAQLPHCESTEPGTSQVNIAAAIYAAFRAVRVTEAHSNVADFVAEFAQRRKDPPLYALPQGFAYIDGMIPNSQSHLPILPRARVSDTQC